MTGGPRPATLVASLRRNAEQRGDSVCLEDSEGALTWSELWDSAAQIASGLAGRGTRRGDTVALALTNRREFLVAWFASAMLGAVEVPIDPYASGSHLEYVLGHARPAVVFAGPEAAVTLAGVRSRLASFHLVGVGKATPCDETWDEFAGTSPVRDLEGLDPSALGAIMYTSGTSGPPKGVMMPLGQHVANGGQAIAAAGISSGDTVLVCLPLHHNMAQGYAVLPAVMAGARLQLLPKFDRHSFWETVRAAQVTVFPFVGGLLHLLLGNEPSVADQDHRLRIAYGVPVSAGVHAQFEERFGVTVVHCYGSTEATIPVWQVPSDRVLGSAGRPIDGYRVECRDASGQRVGPGVSGEICVSSQRPNSMFIGYYRDPETTAGVLRDGWFHTGDVGHFDESGNLWFEGRMTDSIRRFGEFIDPQEIEQRAAEHPAVEGAAAFAVPSPVAEQEVMLAVVSRQAHDLDPNELRSWLELGLPHRSVPRFIEVLPQLPMTPTGKVEKFRLRQRGVQPTTLDFRLRGAHHE